MPQKQKLIGVFVATGGLVVTTMIILRERWPALWAKLIDDFYHWFFSGN
jgi:hypothetical protein